MAAVEATIPSPTVFLRDAYARGIKIWVDRTRSGTYHVLTAGSMATDAIRIGDRKIEAGKRELLKFLKQLPGDLRTKAAWSFGHNDGRIWVSTEITGVELEFLAALEGQMAVEEERRRVEQEINRNFDLRVREEVEADPELIRLEAEAAELAVRIESKRKKAVEEREGRREAFRYVVETKEL